jgi:hypothetical protein
VSIGPRLLVLLLACIATAAPRLARPAEGCTALKWDVTRERALFAGTAQTLTAGRDATSGPRLLPEQLYELALRPQPEITPAAPLGRKVRKDAAFAGLALLHLRIPGNYRISLAGSGWIEVIGERGVIASNDFAGGGCDAPHKVVQFDLPAGTMVLQLSGVQAASMRLSITRAPP